MLNAFRHQRINHIDEANRRIGQHEVLNAFRHQRINHPKCEHEHEPIGLVLNAFRHQRINHSRCPAGMAGVQIRAQRLSASTDKSRPSLGMLGRGRICAQRLSASTDKSPSFGGINSKLGARAQRLSASTDKSRRIFQYMKIPLRVLNAFRHQRINHAITTDPWCQP